MRWHRGCEGHGRFIVLDARLEYGVSDIFRRRLSVHSAVPTLVERIGVTKKFLKEKLILHNNTVKIFVKLKLWQAKSERFKAHFEFQNKSFENGLLKWTESISRSNLALFKLLLFNGKYRWNTYEFSLQDLTCNNKGNIKYWHYTYKTQTRKRVNKKITTAFCDCTSFLKCKFLKTLTYIHTYVHK